MKASPSLHHEESDRAFLSVSKAVIHEWKLTRDVRQEIEHQAAAGRDRESLDPLNGIVGRRAQPDVVELSPTTWKLHGCVGPAETT